ncbi:MAG TPA: hypothetical protein VK498_15850 [Ferruginibacter sp.]|nr:hypothetical protein [Ferruginibacter sp.]
MKKLFLLATVALALGVTGASLTDNSKNKKKKANKSGCTKSGKECCKYKTATVRI